MQKSLGFEQYYGEKSFRQLLNIDSDRTPDILIVESGTVYIIEVAATFDFMTAAKGKGVGGFKSKYQAEIEVLQKQLYSVRYIPLIFDLGRNNLFQI